MLNIQSTKILLLNDNEVDFFYESLESKSFSDNVFLSLTFNFSCWSKECNTHPCTVRGAKAGKGGLKQVNLK